MLSRDVAKGKYPLWVLARVTVAAIMILTLTGLMALQALAEQLDATIELFTELLPAERQDKLENLQGLMEEYFCEYEWIEDFSGARIPFSFRMYLVDESRGFEDRYGARVHVSNDYDLQYLDKDCHFPYRAEDPLEHDAIVYNPLTGLLDFYAYLIIGGEMDKRATLGGDPYFKEAQEVVRNALFSEYYRGWNRRREELEAILIDENVPFRKMLAVYFRALDYVKGEEMEKARSFCRSALAMIGEILTRKDTKVGLSRAQEEQIAKFFTFHYLEIADLFKEDPQGQDVYQRLMALDPQHADVYQKYLQE